MVVSAILNGTRDPVLAATYRSLIGGRLTVVSFVTITELRYGVMRANWGELRRRGLERDLTRLVIVQPDDELMQICAELRASCERDGHGLGQKIHEADRWIAATAIMLDVPLIPNTIFSDVPKLVAESSDTSA